MDASIGTDRDPDEAPSEPISRSLLVSGTDVGKGGQHFSKIGLKSGRVGREFGARPNVVVEAD
jgi:hypothetical protein